jgi:hypothetical protein
VTPTSITHDRKNVLERLGLTSSRKMGKGEEKIEAIVTCPRESYSRMFEKASPPGGPRGSPPARRDTHAGTPSEPLNTLQ